MVKKKKKVITKIIIWLIVLIILAVLGLFAWKIWIPAIKAEMTVTYDSYTATTGTISNSLSFSGSVSVVNSGYTTASKSGTVRALYVKDGDLVQEGDRICRLSTGETVKAALTGTINDVLVEEGSSVNAGGQIVQIVDFSKMKVTMRVDEYDISSVHVGQRCTVTFTALEKSFPSEITHINRLSQSSGNVAYYQVTATVEVTPEVLPGMQVTVSIPREEAIGAVILKMDALSFGRDNAAFVYQMDENGVLYQVPVEVGVDNGNYIEIKSGLKEGDTVYVEVQEEAETPKGLAGLISSFTGGNTQIRNNNRGNTGNNSRGGSMGGYNFGGNSNSGWGGMR